MTLYTLDVSEYQRGLKVQALKDQGYSGLMARCTIGSYVDPEYPRFMAEAKAINFPFAAYWFPHTYVPLGTQLDLLAAHIGDKSIPVGLLDWEGDYNSDPSYPYMVQARDGIRARGMRSNCIYTYGGFWQSHGSPPFHNDFSYLIGADYAGNPSGYGSVVYPGDASSRWNGYGGFSAKTGLQFGSNIIIDGYGRVDANAWRLTLQQLKNLGIFKDWTPVVNPPETLTAPVISVSPAWTDPHSSLIYWAPVAGAIGYAALGDIVPVWVAGTSVVIPKGHGIHVRAYAADFRMSPASNQVVI